jgi:hypothetical protein
VSFRHLPIVEGVQLTTGSVCAQRKGGDMFCGALSLVVCSPAICVPIAFVILSMTQVHSSAIRMLSVAYCPTLKRFEMTERLFQIVNLITWLTGAHRYVASWKKKTKILSRQVRYGLLITRQWQTVCISRALRDEGYTAAGLQLYAICLYFTWTFGNEKKLRFSIIQFITLFEMGTHMCWPVANQLA